MQSREKLLTDATQTQLVSLALYLLGGAGTVVDTEDIAVRVNELAPGRFVWRKYPDQINLELVRVALNNARNKAAGALVNGTGRTGWSLTVVGQRWAEESIRSVQGADLRRPRQQRTAGSVDERRWQRERVRVLTTEAWRQWNESQDETDVAADAAADLYRVDRYVIGRARELKVNRLREMFAEDAEVAPFLDAAAAALLGKGDDHAHDAY